VGIIIILEVGELIRN